MNWTHAPAAALDQTARQAALARQSTLTKPPGSLGRLEEVAVALAAMQGRERPALARPWITVFAGDHGVVAEGVAAFPQVVTQQMLANFVAGGAAIAVLARENGATLEVVDAGTLAAAPLPGVVWDQAGAGTANFTQGPAMTPGQLEHALSAGRRAVERARAAGTDIFIGGEMGIGNTTAAAALGCALLGLPGAALAGPGTGLTAEGVAHKAAVIDRGLALHGFLPPPPGEGRGEGATFAHAAAVPSSPALLPEGEGSRALDATPAARQAAVIDQGPTRHGFLPPPPGEGRGEGASFAHATAAPSSPALLPEGEGSRALDATPAACQAAVIDQGPTHHGFLPPPPGEGRGEGATFAHATAAPSSPALLPEGEGSRALRCLGGFEIAALAGAYIACAQAGLPALVDGFITTAAALAACRIHPGVRDWLLFSHAGSEPGHARLLAALEAKPLLQLDLRLGEGSGAAVALPLLRLACALHKGMATFAEANISNAP